MGWFTVDTAEPGEAYERQILADAPFPGPAGLEIVAAGPNMGLRPGLRRMKAGTRIDIPMLWRAVLRPPINQQEGPIVSILPPRGVAPSDAEPALEAAAVHAPTMVAGPGALDCLFAPGTPAAILVEFSVAALGALGGAANTGEWQWTVRAEGQLPS
jgi:hypothetical protein